MRTESIVDHEDGQFNLVMALYKSDEFKDLQPNPFNITVPELLFVQVEAINTPDNIVALLKKCWATPTYVNLTMWQNIHFLVHSHQM